MWKFLLSEQNVLITCGIFEAFSSSFLFPFWVRWFFLIVLTNNSLFGSIFDYLNHIFEFYLQSGAIFVILPFWTLFSSFVFFGFVGGFASVIFRFLFRFFRVKWLFCILLTSNCLFGAFLITSIIYSSFMFYVELFL